MKITSITISHGITVNLGSYESERYDVTLTAECDGDYKVAADSLFIEAGRLLALQLCERIDAMMIARIKAVSEFEDRRFKKLDTVPEFAWIERLYPQYARDIESELKVDKPAKSYSGLEGLSIEDVK